MNKSIIGAIIVVAVATIAGGLYFGSNRADKRDSLSSNTNQSSTSRAEVSKHATVQDCWTIIDNKVYDITEYIPRHPGGGEILRACGTDGSTMFNQRTTESGEVIGSGTAHSPSAESQLKQYLIGALGA